MSSFLPQEHPALNRMILDRVFEFYDAPVLFSARTAYNQPYLAVAVDEDEGATHFLYVPVSEDRLIAVRTGVVPLRGAFGAPEGGRAYLVITVPEHGEPEVRELATEEILQEWLPDEGEGLNERLETIQSFTVESLTAAAARESRHLVGLEIDQPGAFNRTELPLRIGGPVLTEFQELADSLASESEFALVQLQAASFVFLLTPLVGDSLFSAPSPALEQIESLIEAAGTDAFGDFLSGLTPRRKTHVRDFFAALSDADTGVRLVAASPEGAVREASVSLDKVRTGLTILRASRQLEDETVHLVGYLIALNHRRRTFSVREQEATGGRKRPRTFTGKFDPSVDIEGVASGQTVLYRFELLRESAAPEFDETDVRYTNRLLEMRLLSEQGQTQ